MNSEFRPPTPYEREILEKLLERELSGRDELRWPPAPDQGNT